MRRPQPQSLWQRCQSRWMRWGPVELERWRSSLLGAALLPPTLLPRPLSLRPASLFLGRRFLKSAHPPKPARKKTLALQCLFQLQLRPRPQPQPQLQLRLEPQLRRKPRPRLQLKPWLRLKPQLWRKPRPRLKPQPRLQLKLQLRLKPRPQFLNPWVWHQNQTPLLRKWPRLLSSRRKNWRPCRLAKSQRHLPLKNPLSL